jgi:hypothetical protein
MSPWGTIQTSAKMKHKSFFQLHHKGYQMPNYIQMDYSALFSQLSFPLVIDRKRFRPSIPPKIIGRNKYSAEAAENEKSLI